MVESQRRALSHLIERALPEVAAGGAIACRHFFSGAAAYVEGRIFATLTSVGLALKLPEDRRRALLDSGGRPLRYFPKAPVKKDYVLLPEALGDDPGALAPLMSESIRYCRALPLPKRPKRRTKGSLA